MGKFFGSGRFSRGEGMSHSRIVRTLSTTLQCDEAQTGTEDGMAVRLLSVVKFMLNAGFNYRDNIESESI